MGYSKILVDDPLPHVHRITFESAGKAESPVQ